jgi:signal transduction histidine kinase
MTDLPRRGRLFWKYVGVISSLVGGVLLLSSLVDAYFSYQATKHALAGLQQEKARAAATEIEQFVRDIERQLRWAARTAIDDVAADAEERDIEFLRLLRNVPAITDISQLDRSGKEYLRVSRVTLDIRGSQQDFSREPRFLPFRDGMPYFSAVYFRKESEPYMSIAVPTGEDRSGVTVAEVDLSAIWDVISRIKIGEAGAAYVVDMAGHLIAHPDISLVLQKRDLSSLGQVQSARRMQDATVPDRDAFMIGRGLQGGRVLTTHAAIAPLGWLVFVEQPLSEALAPLQTALLRSAALFAASLALSVVACAALARRMVAPIRVLQAGAARVGGGDLRHRLEVRTGDELEALAEEFNRTAARLEESYASLERKVEERTRDLTEALEQQTAIAEILRVISRSSTDLQQVLDAVAEKVARLCDADNAAVFRLEQDALHLVAAFGTAKADPIPGGHPVSRGSVTGRSVVDRVTVHVGDFAAESDAEFPEGRAYQPHLRSRTMLATPLLREGVPLGAILVRRLEVQPFTERQVELIRTFADQAVIAIETVRLFQELQARNRDLSEALDHQTTTSELLKVISRSTFDLHPVLETLVESATRVCGAAHGVILRFDGEVLRPAAYYGASPEYREYLERNPPRPGSRSASGRAALERRTVHIHDVLAEPDYQYGELQRFEGYRTLVAVPMLREGGLVGVIAFWKTKVEPFTDRQIEVVETFADQAVIAIENVRLFRELGTRTQELTRSVEELRALGEVGQALSSTLDVQQVLTTIVTNAVRLSKTEGGTIYEFDEAEQVFVPRANYGISAELIETLRTLRQRVGDETLIGQAAANRAPIQIPDLLNAPGYPLHFIHQAGFRALLAVPLFREDRIVGALIVRRKAAGEFASGIVDLLQTFATQSTLAIQNARLFREIDEKSRALQELSRHQEQLYKLSTTMQEPLSLKEQLHRVLEAASQIGIIDRVYVWAVNETADRLVNLAGAGFSAEEWQALDGVEIPLAEAGAMGRAYQESRPLLFNQDNPLPPELRLRPPYSALRAIRTRAFLVIPMIARGVTVGVLAGDNRTTGRPITAQTVGLLQTFASHAAVAIANARLFQEIQDKSRDLAIASQHKSQFLANMSHELRTPLHAVLGYIELILDGIFGEVPEPIRENLERAGSNGRHLLRLINDVLDLSKIEAGQLTLSLAEYSMHDVIHAVCASVESLAAEKSIALKVTAPADLPPGRGDEGRITQVLINLVGNAIKFTDAGEVAIDARVSDGFFTVSVTDTGPGIPEADQQRIFGEFQQVDSSSTRRKGGTGLGLAIAKHVVEMHGGGIGVESSPGRGTTFWFTVPVRVERSTETT